MKGKTPVMIQSPVKLRMRRKVGRNRKEEPANKAEGDEEPEEDKNLMASQKDDPDYVEKVNNWKRDTPETHYKQDTLEIFK